MLQRWGQSKHCLFFPQSSPQLCGISFLFHSGLCTLPKQCQRQKHIYCLEYNTECGECIIPKKKKKKRCIFNTGSSCLWKTKWYKCFMFCSAFSADIYSTSLKQVPLEYWAPEDSFLLCSQQALKELVFLIKLNCWNTGKLKVPFTLLGCIVCKKIKGWNSLAASTKKKNKRTNPTPTNQPTHPT